MRMITLDGSRMTDRKTAHTYLAEAMEFPEYYGNNLDALADVLSEYGSNTFVVMEHTAQLKELLGEYGENLLDVFHECAEFDKTFCFFEIQ